MLKIDLKLDESDSDEASFYSIDTESSDFASVSPSLTPVDSFPKLNSRELHYLTNSQNFQEQNIFSKKENQFSEIKETLLPALLSGSYYSQPRPIHFKNRAFDKDIMSTNAGEIAKPEKKRKSLKLSFKKKKKGDKNQLEGSDIASGQESDFSGPSAPSSPRNTLERTFSPISKNDLESNSQPETQTELQIDKEKSSKHQTSKEKSDKRFGSFKLLKKSEKKKIKSNSLTGSPAAPSSNESLSSGAHESASAKINLYDGDKKIPTNSPTSKTADVASDVNEEDSSEKQDPPQTSDTESNPSNPVLIKDLCVAESSSKQSYVSTFHFPPTSNTSPVELDQQYLHNEVQFGKAESKMKSLQEPSSPIKNFKPSQLDKSGNKKTLLKDLKKEEKSIAQEIEEVEKSLSGTNNPSTLEDNSTKSEVKSQKMTTSVTIISKTNEQHMANFNSKIPQTTKIYKNEVQTSFSDSSSCYSPKSDRPLSYNSNIFVSYPPTLSPSDKMLKETSALQNSTFVSESNSHQATKTNYEFSLLNKKNSSSKNKRSEIVSSKRPLSPFKIYAISPNSKTDILTSQKNFKTSNLEGFLPTMDLQRSPSPHKRVPRPLTPEHYAPFGQPRRFSHSSNTEDGMTTDEDYTCRTESPVSYSTVNVCTDGDEADANSSIANNSNRYNDSWVG